MLAKAPGLKCMAIRPLPLAARKQQEQECRLGTQSGICHLRRTQFVLECYIDHFFTSIQAYPSPG